MGVVLTTNYSIPKPIEGEEVDDWAPEFHSGMDIIDTQIKNRQNEAAAASALATGALPKAGGTMTGKLNTIAVAAPGAGLCITPGSIAPTTPVNGDIWATSTDFFVRLSGSTYALSKAGHTHLQSEITGLVTALGLLAPKASPALTGIPTAPTAAQGTDTTQLATTAFVTDAVAGKTVAFKTANYTLVLADAGRLIAMNMAGDNTWTVPLNADEPFPLGAVVEGGQYNTGQTTITPTPGVILRAAGGKLTSNVRYSGWTIKKIATNEWWVFGDLVA